MAMDEGWDDERWKVAADTAWQAGLRWLQCWWRSEQLGLPPGPFSPSSIELVGSTLAVGSPPQANFLSDEAAEAVKQRLTAGGGGLVGEDRLRRNLLSSQPMCFNLFGHLRGDPDALLPWVRQVVPSVQIGRVLRIELEWAPAAPRLGGGSAFDAFVEFECGDGRRGFIGVECKYHEHLPNTDVKNVRDVYRTHTRASAEWVPDAEASLDRSGLRQLWLNTLLAETLAADEGYEHWAVALVACAHDRSARASTNEVRSHLSNAQRLQWQPWETILSSIVGHSEWRERFWTRYLDFSPVAHLLGADDPRMSSASVSEAAAIADRVLGEGSVLERLETRGLASRLLEVRLAAIVDELKALRIDAGELEDA